MRMPELRKIGLALSLWAHNLVGVQYCHLSLSSIHLSYEDSGSALNVRAAGFGFGTMPASQIPLPAMYGFSYMRRVSVSSYLSPTYTSRTISVRLSRSGARPSASGPPTARFSGRCQCPNRWETCQSLITSKQSSLFKATPRTLPIVEWLRVPTTSTGVAETTTS